jgi:aryl-alcohol dehydrogenase-like predicted oxidoreductase
MRRLGRTQLEVPTVVFGAWAIGGWNWGGSNDDEAVRALHAGFDAGMTAVDTAPIYGFGRPERVVGRALAGRRDGVVVMTKVGLRWDDPRGERFFRADDAPGGPADVHRNSRPDSVRHEVEQSLERLGVERLDLVQVHWHDPTTPIADTLGELVRLRDEGKLREIGVSNYTPALMEEAQRALGDVPLASDQPKYSLVARGIESDVLPWARANDVGLLVYSPIEQGLLTGKVDAARRFPPDDGRAKRPTFTPENRALVNATLARVVQPIARARDASVAQIAIAWTVAEPGIKAAIVGARRPDQARENARAGSLELSPAERAAIRGAFEGLDLALPGEGLGARARRIVRRLFGL